MNRWFLFATLIAAAAVAQTTLPLPPSGNVTLPLDEYNKLVEQAGQPARKTEAPPLAHAVNSAQLNLVVGNENVTGRILLDGEVFLKGDRKVPLVSGMVVTDAQRQGGELPVQLEGGVHTALIAGPSEFSAALDVGLPLNIEPGRASFNLPVPWAGTARLTLSVPGEQTQVTLIPGLITTRTSANGRTIVEATLVPGQMANVGWASRLAAAPPVVPKELRFLSDVKTLISVTEAELGITVLAEVSVIQGEPEVFTIQPPEGYELSTATGPTLASSDVEGKTVVLKVTTPPARSHQFLISFVRANLTPKAEVPLVTFKGTQRETGEVLIEGEGAIELKATVHGGLRRMDLKETSSYLQSLARTSPESAYRYQKKAGEVPSIGLEWVRFPDSNVLSAVAQRAVVTTLVTNEGRSLTEVRLTLKNKSQPFLKVGLPAGASILSAEVAGEKVKPVEGADGNRVPLLRPGFRPADSYSISFVFLHSGSPFAKKGGAELALPKMDIPVGLLEWEVFLPSQYTIANFGGNALQARLLPAAAAEQLGEETTPGAFNASIPSDAFGPVRLSGHIVDTSGAVVPGTNLVVRHLGTGVEYRAVTNLSGQFEVHGLPSGRVRITATHAGFVTQTREVDFDASRGLRVSFPLQVGSVTETVEVSASNARVETKQIEQSLRQNAASKEDTAASSNVIDLQRRVVGVLPIAVKVPRTGNAYRFARPLVMDEETKLTFNYKTK